MTAVAFSITLAAVVLAGPGAVTASAAATGPNAKAVRSAGPTSIRRFLLYIPVSFQILQRGLPAAVVRRPGGHPALRPS
ncbi:hypothetical protein ACFQX6_50150 [Streptosporangium lutulentum]